MTRKKAVTACEPFGGSYIDRCQAVSALLKWHAVRLHARLLLERFFTSIVL